MSRFVQWMQWMQQAAATIYKDYGLFGVLVALTLVAALLVFVAQALNVRLGDYINSLLNVR